MFSHMHAIVIGSRDPQNHETKCTIRGSEWSRRRQMMELRRADLQEPRNMPSQFVSLVKRQFIPQRKWGVLLTGSW